MFREGKTDERNGTEIIRRIIERKRYQSVTGAWMNIDQNGDVQGNYTVLQPRYKTKHARSLADSNDDKAEEMPKTNSHKLELKVVGHFVYDETSNVTLFSQLASVEWVRPGHVPLDEPPCGFDGKACDKSVARVREILTGVLAAILIITSVMISIAYRNWKYEQEIDGLLWKISRGDISFDEDQYRAFSASRISLISNNSLTQAKMSGNVDTSLAKYKGAIVSVKAFCFAKHKKTSNAFDYLSRENKKEMKILKEMHHKNINPFIGACTQADYAQTLFIVSEFCAKGSLRDVIENKEIRLDEEFIASLIYGIMSGKCPFSCLRLDQITRVHYCTNH